MWHLIAINISESIRFILALNKKGGANGKEHERFWSIFLPHRNRRCCCFLCGPNEFYVNTMTQYLLMSMYRTDVCILTILGIRMLWHICAHTCVYYSLHTGNGKWVIANILFRKETTNCSLQAKESRPRYIRVRTDVERKACEWERERKVNRNNKNLNRHYIIPCFILLKFQTFHFLFLGERKRNGMYKSWTRKRRKLNKKKKV